MTHMTVESLKKFLENYPDNAEVYVKVVDWGDSKKDYCIAVTTSETATFSNDNKLNPVLEV